MALARSHGVVVSGVSGIVVRVEVDVSAGLPGVGVVGLPDASVSEARWRARCAIGSAGRTWPDQRITINLSPAEVRKQGAGLDLPIACAILAASGQIRAEWLASRALVGELGLDGRIHAGRGVLAGALAARQNGFDTIVVPDIVAHELVRVPGLQVETAATLGEVLLLLEGEESPHASVPRAAPRRAAGAASGDDLADVRGHARARLALEVAAAGGHHLALVGPPGVGKTLLADRLSGLLPPLDDETALEVAVLHSLAGEPRSDDGFDQPPARAPHHSASAAAVLGTVRGGRVVPGAVTLAHRGVLVLDEAPEFCRPALEGLRQPLESGRVALDRAGWSGAVPARFQLALTANPCPCGQRIGTGGSCTCPAASVRRYAARLSGPLMDRIDIRLAVQRPSGGELANPTPAESSACVRQRVVAARERSLARLSGGGARVNAEVPAGELRRRYLPDAGGLDLLTDAERRATSLRGTDRVLRVAWTVADLAGHGRPTRDDVALALGLRGASTPWA